MMREKKIFQPLTSVNICEIYNLLHEEGLISFSATAESKRKLEGVVASINGSNFGVPNYPSRTEKTVAYLYFLLKNHPFIDGNKRTAVLVFSVLCSLNTLTPEFADYELDALAIFLAQLHEPDHQHVIRTVAKKIFTKDQYDI